MKPNYLSTFAAATILSALIPAAAQTQPPPQPYKIVKTIPLGEGERWDYATFDPSANRVYVAHGDHVTVVDAGTGTVFGQIGTLPGGTHGIGISVENGVGYTDDGKAGVATSFDLKTLKLGNQIPTAPDADGIIFDPVSRHLFVINGDSGSVTVIDPKTNSSLVNINIGAGLEAAVADGKGRLFVDGAENHDVVSIDTRTNTVIGHFPMPGCVRPHGIAVDADTRRLFATCVNNVMVVVDADNGANIATLPIGSGSDGAAFDPVRKRAFSSNGDGTLTVVQEKTANEFAVLATITTMQSARTIAIDPGTGRLFLPGADIAKIDPPAAPGGRPHITFALGSLKLLVLEPQLSER